MSLTETPSELIERLRAERERLRDPPPSEPPVAVVVTGGREYAPSREDVTVFLRLLSDVLAAYPEQEAVLRHGGCRGVDKSIAALVKQAFPRIAVVEFKANWDLLGKLAGPKRNAEMLEGADALIAFPGGRGTTSCIRIAEQKRVPVYFVREPVVREKREMVPSRGEHKHSVKSAWWSCGEAAWFGLCASCHNHYRLGREESDALERAVEDRLKTGG